MSNVFLFSVSSLLCLFHYVQFTKPFIKHGESSELISTRPFILSGEGKLAALTSSLTELRSDSAGRLNADAAKSVQESCLQTKFFLHLHFRETMHFSYIEKYCNNSTFRKIPETMSLFEMRLFQNINWVA